MLRRLHQFLETHNYTKGSSCEAIEHILHQRAAYNLATPLQTDHDVCRLHQEGINVGFPVLVKAALGGGGKGMKLAVKEDELQVNFSKPATFCCAML